MSLLKKIFWISLAVKLVIAAFLPLTSDEAYYWVWSRFMQLSYYDHPPFVAWLFWLGQFFNFYGGMVRWPGILLGQASLALWLVLLKPYLTERQRVYWLLLALLSPLVGGSGILVTPDLPLMFFYALSLWIFFQWQKEPTFKWSLALGVAMGLGFSSKYMMVLFALSLLPVVLWTPASRHSFFKNLFVLVLGGAVGTLPVWLWNFTHDFASLKFQAEHGLGQSVWKPHWTSDYALLQILLIFPPVLYLAWKGRKKLPKAILFLAWVPLAFFFFTTFRGYVEANWPITAYPAIFALAATQARPDSKLLKFTLSLWAFSLALFTAIVIAQPKWSRSMKFKEFHQFDRLAEAAKNLEPLYARSYQMAATLHFKLRRPVYKLRHMNRVDFYDFLEQSEPPKKFYLAVEKEDGVPKEYKDYKIDRVIPVDDLFEIRQMELR